MSVKELVHELEQLNDKELEEVATYIAFLKFRTWQTKQATVAPNDELASLYTKFGDEERADAEAGLQEYLSLLQAEDVACRSNVEKCGLLI